MKEWIRDLSMQARAERKRKCYYQEIFTGDLEKELGTGTQFYTGNTQTWQKWFKWQTGQDRYFRHSRARGVLKQ